MPCKVLVVDDEKKITEVLKAYLESEGYSVITAYTGLEALDKVASEDPDLIILDLMLPELSGEEVCGRLREFSEVPIIMLTAKTSESDRIGGLNLGADDYVIKPFSPREVVARVKAVLRRTAKTRCRGGRLSFKNKDLEIDLNGHEVYKRGERVNLTPTEFKLLTLLAQSPGQVFSRSVLTERLQGYDYEGYDRTIDVHVKNLRKKVEDNSQKPEYILTVYGVGYKFGVDPDE
ncbi:MAG: response regulator transcription factor [Firmicutes bacterium]|nr:response regulator transcription factor [Bacillota bacterium]